MPNKRQFKYLSRDYEGLKSDLLSLSKQYFPSFFTDFNEYTIETMLAEQMAYVGDNLNFYIDDRYRQMFRQYATDPEAIFRIAKSMGYKPQTVSVAFGKVELSQIVPAILNGSDYEPDVDFAGVVSKGSVFSDSLRSNFYTLLSDCNMGEYDSYVLESESGGVPESYRIYKSANVRSGDIKEKNIDVDEFQRFLEINLDNNVAFIESIVDADNNTWYEVDFLAQDTVFEEISVNKISSSVPSDGLTSSALKTKRVSRRFVVDHKSDGRCVLQFGSGVDFEDEGFNALGSEDLLTTNELSRLNLQTNFTIENFLKNDSFGLVPNNTTLRVRYITSKGDEENVNSNTVVNITDANVDFSQTVPENVENSFQVNNPQPIIGASFLNNPEKVRQESFEAIYTQRRCVTAKDFSLRSKLLPKRFGSIDKVYVEKNYDYDSRVDKGFQQKSINIHVVSKDRDDHLVATNDIGKENLKNYLSEFRMISDTINILDGYIINIGVDFDFISEKSYNADEVLFNISEKVEEFFNVNRWELNQPIVLEELRRKMFEAEGALSITNVDFTCKFDTEQGYSGVYYDVSVNGSNFDSQRGILYPPADIGIFELKYPPQDIRGKHV